MQKKFHLNLIWSHLIYLKNVNLNLKTHRQKNNYANLAIFFCHGWYYLCHIPLYVVSTCICKNCLEGHMLFLSFPFIARKILFNTLSNNWHRAYKFCLCFIANHWESVTGSNYLRNECGSVSALYIIQNPKSFLCYPSLSRLELKIIRLNSLYL